MEGEIGDPYEERLLAVFNSCLDEGDERLGAEGVRALCDKLQLEERSDELIEFLEERGKVLVGFGEFRDGLVELLGQRTPDLTEACASSGQATDATADGSALRAFRGERAKLAAGKVNGAMNGELDHSDMGGFSGIGYYQSAPKEWLEQIFEKLDMDCDGLISFDEFAILFENEKNAHENSTIDWANGSSSGDVVKSRDGGIVVNILGPHQTGYARIGTIVTMWEVAGVPDAATLLSDLGFTSSEIRLTDLTTVLCEELKNLRDEPDNAITPMHMSLLKGALTLYQEEVRCMITLVEHLSGERDKLRIDVAEANERANLLAQEIDEHHVRLEKSRQEQLKQLEHRHAEITKDLSIQCTSEREAHTEALKALDRQLQVVQHEEQHVRTKLANALRDNQTLEVEVESLTEQIDKLKSSNKELLLQVQNLAAEHEQVETTDDTRETEQIILLVDRIKTLQSSMADLRDQNDEITAELEFMKIRNSEVASLALESDVIDELPENTGVILERSVRATMNDFSGNSTEDNEEDAKFRRTIAETLIRELKNLSDEKKPLTMERRIFQSFITTVIAELETNSSRISTVGSREDAKSTEIAEETEMESIVETINDLEIECEERTSESLRDLVVSHSETAKLVKRSSHTNDDTTINIDKNFNNLDGKTPTKNKITSLRDYPPRKDENSSPETARNYEKNNVALNVTQTLSSENDENAKDSLGSIFHELEAKLVVEKKQLTDRCAELERSLDLLRGEYDQCEDYWAAKLEEERQLFEQEQKISDEKFTELIGKIAEYEEQFGTAEKSRNDGRLSPIEERYNLEQQYADLEEELELLRSRMEDYETQKEMEIAELRNKLSIARRSPISTINVSTQFSFDETSLEKICKPFDFSTTISQGTNNCGIETPQRSYATATMGHTTTTTTKKIVHYGTTSNHRIFDPTKLNQIAETGISNDSTLNNSSGQRRDCYCQQIEAYTSMEELCRVHKAEINRLYQKKLEIDNECMNLSKQKESLTKGVMELKNVTSVNRGCSETTEVDDGGCRMNIGVLKALTDKLQAQEKKRRNLKISLSHQQQYAERMLQQTWQQHSREVTTLRYALQKTEEKLKSQVKTNQEQADRLAKADILSTDLYVQNAHLIASVKRLEHHCLALAQFGAESTSI